MKIYQIVTKALKSKTLIVNWATLIAATLTMWTGSDIVADYPQVAAAMVAALSGVNMLLRAVTSLGLDKK